MSSYKIIIGAGAPGLMTAQELAKKGNNNHIYDHNKTAARKFSVAGHGRFNLSYNEDINSFVEKYDAPEIKAIVKEFTNQDTIYWLIQIGIVTHVGSSKKYFISKTQSLFRFYQHGKNI